MRRISFLSVFLTILIMAVLLTSFKSTTTHAAVIKSGETKTGNIASTAQLDSYKFFAISGNTVTILMGKKNGDLFPMVELHASGGTVVTTTSGSISATIEAQPLAQTGIYSIVCRDLYGIYTGEYNVSLIKNPGRANSTQDPDMGKIKGGEIKTGTIDVGDLDAGWFYAKAGNAVTILMGKKNGDLFPMVELHAPDGTVVTTSSGSISATIEAQPLDQTGIYFIICRDLYGIYSGTYNVSLLIE